MELSDQSARRLGHYARNLQGLTVMLTLTYPAVFPGDGSEVKRHIANMRKWLARRNVGGLWYLEFQERGAPHVHMHLNARLSIPEVKAAWYSIVGSGDPKHLAAGARVEKIRSAGATGHYVTKYCTKQRQKRVPEGFENVGRFWGVFNIKCEQIATFEGEVGEVEELTELLVDESTGEVLAEEVVKVTVRGAAMAKAVRVLRGLYASYRRSWGCKKRRRDNGIYGFQARGMGPKLANCLPRLGLQPIVT